MPHWPVPLWHKPIDLGLERVRGLLTELGNPEQHLPPVVHAAGTNGKGSTLAFLRAMLEAAGYLVHVYTSPHLVRFNERIRLAGKEISDEYLYDILEECRIASEKLPHPVTFFEGTTVAAFLAFSRIPADIVLLETGLGGRLDATNVIERPDATIITPISLDHTAFLGTSIAEIAFEKAGIMKPGVPCITSLQPEEAEAVFEAKAIELACPWLAYGYDWGVSKTDSGMHYKSRFAEYHLPLPGLPGDHQLLNAATAITALHALPHFKVSETDIRNGLQSVYWPGRLQHLHTGHFASLLPEGWELWIDGAHNEGGSQVLALWAESKQDRPLYAITGMTKGRDSTAFFKPLAPFFKQVCGITVEAEPSSHPGSFITEAALSAGISAMTVHSLEEAIQHFVKISHTPSRILICGSLYLAGDVLAKN